MRTNFRLILVVCCGVASAWAQDRLTLGEAGRMALENHPGLASARFLEQAASQLPVEVRSRLYPTVYGSVTAVAVENSTTSILAGSLNSASVYDRLAAGSTVTQLITDFGRTRALEQSARLSAAAQSAATSATAAQVLVAVHRAYYAALRARAVLKVAEETVSARQVVADQAATLAANKLKSELDVAFARVNLEEAKLLLSNARNDSRSADAELSTALGLSQPRSFTLVEEPLPEPLPARDSTMVDEALQNRPEVLQAQQQQRSAEQFSRAEHALTRPSITAVGTLGYSPAHVDRVGDTWAAGGVNVDLPFLNGGLYRARIAEAESRAKAAERQARDLSNRISRDVHLSYLGAENAFQHLGLTAQLLDQAQKSLQLAQARYDLGLGSIVELSQAQLNLTRAQIAQTSARFDYQSARALLDFERGAMR